MSEAHAHTKAPRGIGNRLMPPRFLAFLATLAAAWFTYRGLMPPDDWRDGTAMAFDFAALVFLASLVPLLRGHDAAAIRAHARANDAGRLTTLALTGLLTFVVMAAITGEMAGAQRGDMTSVAKLVGTLLLIWLFANGVYALHYAHLFYGEGEDGRDRGGIDFPGTDTPDYWDFAYFAFTMGMTFQTSDVQMTSGAVRKVALAHCFAAFVFNIGVIAFTINVLGGAG
ncbi:DUF1345 domain-containing protein [Aurantiacibacter luteus]|uniref:Membrane protein n=1 Tax=Aurantiacibacter luteus TaxID=1581420 RepID=A0A0G9MUU6_9SPHN|nr:DUF1345 domain-containing protein [Aurantiacibacter luteus]KLE34512.1 membrane protein [Aurantiacibacter luteus]